MRLTERNRGERVCLLCVRERVRVSESENDSVGVIFENTLFEIKYQSLDFLAFYMED